MTHWVDKKRTLHYACGEWKSVHKVGVTHKYFVTCPKCKQVVETLDKINENTRN